MRTSLIIGLALWVVLSVGGKLIRYEPYREPAGPRAERLVREVLAAHGWTLDERSPLTGAGLYIVQSFVKNHCDRRLKVVVLGVSSEAIDVVLDRLGPDTAFFDGDQFSPRPVAAGAAGRELRALARLSADEIMPILAVNPAPRKADHSRCSWPSGEEWALLGGGKRNHSDSGPFSGSSAPDEETD